MELEAVLVMYMHHFRYEISRQMLLLLESNLCLYRPDTLPPRRILVHLIEDKLLCLLSRHIPGIVVTPSETELFAPWLNSHVTIKFIPGQLDNKKLYCRVGVLPYFDPMITQ